MRHFATGTDLPCLRILERVFLASSCSSVRCFGMNRRVRRPLRLGLALLLLTAILWIAKRSMAAEGHPPFEGEKTTWRGGFDRYDFIMDDATGTIKPMKAPDKEATSFGIDETL